VRTDPSAVPGAETEGRAVAITSAARPSLRDRLPCEKPSRPEAATNTARCLDAFPYALTAKFQFTLNQDNPSMERKSADRNLPIVASHVGPLCAGTAIRSPDR